MKLLAAGREVASTTSDGNGMYQFAGVPSGTVTVQVALEGFKTAQRALALRGTTTLDVALEVGSVTETVNVMAEPPSRSSRDARARPIFGRRWRSRRPGRGRRRRARLLRHRRPRAAIEDAMAAVEAAASGGALGELFEYKLKQPVTVRRNQSAMVPVVQHDVAVERVSLWSAARGVAQPLRAVWLTNDTGLTLDGGSLTLVEGGAFAGEGLVEAIKPGEKRFVSYAVDLGVRVTATPQDSGRRVSRIRIASSVMTQSVEERASTLYTIRNDDATARDVVIEHPAAPAGR